MDTIQQDADIILRSSDGQIFRCWKALLSMSSPVFKDMFTLPQADGHNDELATVDLAEDGHTVDLIVVVSHPPSFTGKQFKITGIRELRGALEAAEKYEMESLRGFALGELSNPLLLHKDPLRIYALACQYGRHDAVQLAAKHTLALPTLIREPNVPELEKLNAGELYRLMAYRDACTAAACSLAGDHTWINFTRFSDLFGCIDDEARERTTVRCPPSRKHRSGRLEDAMVYGWWMEYMRKSKQALQKSPRGDTVKSKELTNGIFSPSPEAGQRKEHVWKTFLSFVEVFAETIDNRVAEVEINPGV